MLDTVVTGDCLDVLPALPAGCADLVFADPPLNVGYRYDVYNDRRPKAEYLAWADRWLAAAVRVLKPHGSLWVATGDEYAAEYKLKLHTLGLTMRNWCVWHYTFGPHQARKFGRDHANLLYYVRHPKRFTLSADAVRVESQRQRSGDKQANPAGRVPGDVWSFPRLVGNAKERTGHPCQMPEAVLERVIRASSDPGALVLDPFVGSGVTLAVAKRLGRRFFGIELSPGYAETARARCAAVGPAGQAGERSTNASQSGNPRRLGGSAARFRAARGFFSGADDAHRPCPRGCRRERAVSRASEDIPHGAGGQPGYGVRNARAIAAYSLMS